MDSNSTTKPSLGFVALTMIPHVMEAPGYLSYIFTIVVIAAIAYYWQKDRPTAKLPLINPKAWFDVCNFRSRSNYVLNAPRILEDGIKRVGKTKPFRVMTEKDEMIILPPSMAHHIRNDPNLGFNPFIARTFHAGIHGFEPLAENVSHDMLVDMIKSKLTPALSQLTEPMAQEMTKVCEELLSDETEWHELVLKDKALDIVARLSSRVFMGEELSSNKGWLKLTKEYTVNGPKAATILHLFPGPLRPLIANFLPITREIRSQLKQALAIIEPLLEKRRHEKEALAREGKTKVYADATEWFNQVSKGAKFNAHYLQLGLAFAAVHSSADALNHTMLEILQKPEIIQPLREEIISVLGNDEWSKRVLFKLKLMDSVLKEAQRLKPVLLVTMNREVLRNITLPDGTVLEKGDAIGVASHCMRDEETWQNANSFEPYRFLRMREDPNEGENAWQFSSTSSRHLGFGHGQHGCPGRFFVTHELKIALCHLLLKYDWKLAPGCKPQVEQAVYFLNSDSKARVMLRRRKEEIPL